MNAHRLCMASAAAFMGGFVLLGALSGSFQRKLDRAANVASREALVQYADEIRTSPADAYEALKRRCTVFNLERCIEAHIRSQSSGPYRWGFLKLGAILFSTGLLWGAVGYVAALFLLRGFRRLKSRIG